VGGGGDTGEEGGDSDVGFGLAQATSGGDINGEVGSEGEPGAGGDGGYGVNGYAAPDDSHWTGSVLGNDWIEGISQVFGDGTSDYYIDENGIGIKCDEYDSDEGGNIVYLMRAGQGGQGGQGGTGGDAGDGGEGGIGGTIRFAVDEGLTDATFSASGGDGGDGGIHFTGEISGETVHYCNSGGLGGTGGQGGTGGDGGIGGPAGDGGQGGTGGTGGNAGDGGNAGTVQVWASSISGMVNINADGGAGGYGGDGGDGGEGGQTGEYGASNYIPDGYPGSYYTIANGADYVSIVNPAGPQGIGGNAGTGGDGGDGGEIDVVLSGDITENGQLNAYALGGAGGTGGDGGLGSINGNGNNGGAGGTGGTIVTTVANGITSSSSFTGVSNGGNGGNGGTGDTGSTDLSAGGDGGLGGDAGTVQFATEDDIAGIVDIDVYGGDGGSGGGDLCTGFIAGEAGAGGNGGDGGTGQVWADDLTEKVTITANGGTGGDGGSVGTGTQMGTGGIGGIGGIGGYADLVLTGDIKADTDVHANGGNGGAGGGSRNTVSSAGGGGGNGGTTRVFADDIGTIDTAEHIDDDDKIDLTVQAYAGVGGNGGNGIVSSAGGAGGDGGTSVSDFGDTRTDYNTIKIVLSGDVLSDATIQGAAVGGNGGDGGTGTGEPLNGDGAGGDGGEGGHIYMWADDIAQQADVKFWINGGEGGTGTPSGLGGDAPLNTIYVDTDTISGSVTGHALGGTGGTDGRVYIGGTEMPGSIVTRDTDLGNGGSTAPPGVLPVPPVAPASPLVPAAPVPAAPAATQTTPDVALTDNSSLSPADRIADFIAQLQALGFQINEADLFPVIVSDVTYIVVPATDPDRVDLWLVFDEQGALVSPVPGVDIGTEPLTPDLLAQITTLAAFVQQVSTIPPSTLADLTQTIDESLARIDNAIVALLQDLAYPDAATFISRVLENPPDYDLVAGWPCPAGYSEEERVVQLKEDYMKNYLVVMEALLADGMDPDAPEPDTGAGQLTAWAATIIKYIQTSRVGLEENYNTLSAHADGTPWRYNEMQGYLDNEAAYNPVETDLAALESLSGVSGGLSDAGAAVISQADIKRISGIMQLIAMGKFPDDAFTLASAAFDEGVSRYGLSEYVTERCREWYV